MSCLDLQSLADELGNEGIKEYDMCKVCMNVVVRVIVKRSTRLLDCWDSQLYKRFCLSVSQSTMSLISFKEHKTCEQTVDSGSHETTS